MKIAFVFLVAALIPIFADAVVRGVKQPSMRRELKGDDGGDGDIPGLPEIPELPELPDDACFSADAHVEVAGKGLVSMKDLSIGDQVQTGNNLYQPVFGFAHYEPQRKTEFLSIEMSNGKSLEITEEHLVFLYDQTSPIRAGSVQKGDVLHGHKGSSTKVISIAKLEKQGLYAPLTEAGVVVVEGILASNYVTLQPGNDNVVTKGGFALMSQHQALHMTLSPLRMLCMGISSTFCGVNKDQGMPTYVSHGIALAHFADEQQLLVQFLMGLVAFSILVLSMFVESLFGAAWAPVALILLFSSYVVARTARVSVRIHSSKSKTM